MQWTTKHDYELGLSESGAAVDDASLRFEERTTAVWLPQHFQELWMSTLAGAPGRGADVDVYPHPNGALTGRSPRALSQAPWLGTQSQAEELARPAGQPSMRAALSYVACGATALVVAALLTARAVVGGWPLAAAPSAPADHEPAGSPASQRTAAASSADRAASSAQNTRAPEIKATHDRARAAQAVDAAGEQRPAVGIAHPEAPAISERASGEQRSAAGVAHPEARVVSQHAPARHAAHVSRRGAAARHPQLRQAAKTVHPPEEVLAPIDPHAEPDMDLMDIPSSPLELIALSQARTALEYDPVPTPPPLDGVLRINSRPWSRVFVDGEPVGDTPLRAVIVKPGLHEVRLVNPTFDVEKTFDMYVASGGVATHVELLDP